LYRHGAGYGKPAVITIIESGIIADFKDAVIVNGGTVLIFKIGGTA